MLRLHVPHLLRVCQNCRTAGTSRDGTQPGVQLVKQVAARYEAWSPRAQVVLLPTNCLGQCERPCAAALSGPGKTPIVLADLGHDGETAGALLHYAEAYLASPDGRVAEDACPAELWGKVQSFTRRIE